jgi:hypothetical protein
MASRIRVTNNVSAEILTKPYSSLVGGSGTGANCTEWDSRGKRNYAGRIPSPQEPISYSADIPFPSLADWQIVGVAEIEAVSLVKAGGAVVTALVVRVLRD